MLAAILRAHPAVRGILFDVPDAVANARKLLDAQGVAGRCEVVAGDFFEGVPEGGDVYLLAGVVHDWEDEIAVQILRNCHAAMRKDARLLLAEHLAPPGNHPFPGALIDISMLVNTGGQERTEAEFRALLASARFDLTQIIRTGWGRLIEGIPA